MLHTAKVGDTRLIRATYTSSNSSDDFTGATGAKFTMGLAGSTAKVNAASATIISASGTTIVLSYSPTSPDMDTVGYYQVQWEVTAGGKIVKLPSLGFDIVWIT